MRLFKTGSYRPPVSPGVLITVQACRFIGGVRVVDLSGERSPGLCSLDLEEGSGRVCLLGSLDEVLAVVNDAAKQLTELAATRTTARVDEGVTGR